MKVLLAGNRGYLGSVVHEVLKDAGHDVVGLDSGLFDTETVQPRVDIRDVSAADLEGCEAVVNLAALCNDACGDLSTSATFEINQVAAVRLAELAREAGVLRYVFASSCSVYGAAGSIGLDETSPVAPDTAYAASKIEAEGSIGRLAAEEFLPVSLRFATLFGVSPSFRSDILVNRIVGTAVRWGVIRVNGDGNLWRPLLHVRDAAEAIQCVLAAEPSLVRGETYNVGSPHQNLRLIDVVRTALDAFPSARVTHGPAVDHRSYSVSFNKFMKAFDSWESLRSVADGVHEVLGAYRTVLSALMGAEDWAGTDRREHLLAMRSAGLLDQDFRWTGHQTSKRSA